MKPNRLSAAICYAIYGQIEGLYTMLDHDCQVRAFRQHAAQLRPQLN